MSKIAKLKDSIKEIKYNPAAIQRQMLDTLESSYNGDIDVVDPTNPFVFLLEASAVMTSAAMSEAEALTRKQYPSMAQTLEELYLHMSDTDFLNRFATPSRSSFQLLLHKEELRSKAVETDVGGVRKLVIPRHTEIMVSDYVFTLQYPIELRVLGHGGFQVVYDVSEYSPLETIKSNMLDWQIVNLKGEEYLLITIPAKQMKMTSRLGQLNKATSYSEVFKFTDQYYYCRVFANLDEGWTEIRTTHTDQVFDPYDPTVVLQVQEQKLRVTLPHVYNTTDLVNKELRIDIYTTHGELDLILENMTPGDFGIKWRDVAKKNLGRYSLPLADFSNISIFSDSVVVGGSNGVDFETLRRQVIENSLGDSNIPITNNQMLNRLESEGYTAILNIDNITNRIYLASRELPAPERIENLSSVGSYFGKLQGRLRDLLNHRGVMDNGNRITITPDALFEENNGITTLVNDVKRQNIENTPGEEFIHRINNERLFFSPFFYVMNISSNRFFTRIYHLNQPTVGHRQFLNENNTTGVIVSTSNVKIYRESYGYLMRVKVFFDEYLNENYTPDDFVCQLTVDLMSQGDYAYMNGTFSGMTEDDHRIYDFPLVTNFDVTENHGLIVNNFGTAGNPNNAAEVPLDPTCTLTYYARRDMLPDVTTVENKINHHGHFAIGKNGFIATLQEQFRLEIGEYLEGFWENARTLASPKEYLRHTEDRYATYKQDVFKRDPITGSIEFSVDADGNLNYRLLHRKGDIVVKRIASDADNQAAQVNGELSLGSLTVDPDNCRKLTAAAVAGDEQCMTGLSQTTLDLLSDPPEGVSPEDFGLIYEYRKGDIVRDDEGNPVLKVSREILFEADIFLLDGRYKYADNQDAVSYMNSVTKSVTTWLREDIRGFQAWALEQTKVMFYPRQTIGMSEARVEENQLVPFDLEQSFRVTYYLSNSRYNDLYLRESLTNITSEVINKHLTRRQVVKNDIIRELSERVGSDAIGLDVSGLGGEHDYTAVTMTNDGERCSVKKRLYRTMEGSLSVQENITILMIRHEDG